MGILLLCSPLSMAHVGGKRLEERVIRFHSDIRVRRDRTVEVSERIEVNAMLRDIRHGIDRDIQLDYPSPERGDRRLGIDGIRVQKDGRDEPYRTERQDRGVRIAIGDETRNVTFGRHVYEITYVLEYSLERIGDRDELHLGVNGTGDKLQTDTISATVRLPAGAVVTQKEARTEGNSAQEQEYKAEELGGSVTLRSTEWFAPGETMTIRVGWEKGDIDPPPLWSALARRLRRYPLVYLSIVPLLLGLLASAPIGRLAARKRHRLNTPLPATSDRQSKPLKALFLFLPALTLSVGLIAWRSWGGTLLLPIASALLHLALSLAFLRLRGRNAS